LNHLFKIIIFLLLASLSLSATEKLKKVTLQLSWFDQFQFAGYYMAKEKGFYKKLGLDVEIKPFSFGLDIVQDVEKNKVDFSIGRETLILERAKNKKIVALYALFQSSPLILLSTKESKINSISDFKGKRIMTTIDDASEVSLKAMINSNKVAINDLNFLRHTHNINDLITKKTDVISAYISKAPFVLQEMNIEYNVFEPKQRGFDMYSDLLYTSEHLISNDVKTVRAFKKASLMGWEYAYSNIDESAEVILKKYNSQKLSKEELVFEAKELKKLSFYNTNSLGNMDKNKFRRIADLYNVMGLLENKIDLENFIYNENIYNLKFTQKEQNYLKEKQNITMCISPDWMPYEKFDTEGKHAGISADYFIAFQKSINIPIKVIKTKTWAQSIEFAKQRKCDILSLVIKTEERQKYLNFTNPYFDTSYVLATKPNISFINNLDNLRDVNIGVLEGSAFIETLRINYPSLTLTEVKNIEEGLQKVTQGDLFGFIDSFATIGYLLQTKFYGELQISGKFKEQLKLGIGVRNDDPILLNIFNSLIENLPFEMKEKIFHKHISIKYEKGFDYDFLFKIAIFGLIVLSLVFYRYKLMTKYTRKIENYLELVDSHVLISYSDKNGKITDVSEALCKLTGYTKKELIGKAHSIFRHKDMESSSFKNMWTTLLQNNFWQGEVKNLNKDGSSYWAFVKINAIYDDNGNKKGYCAIRENITNKKEIEKLSITDALTQIPNRLYLDTIYEQESNRADRYNTELSLILIDIDYFKKVNDTYGHKVGDDVLIEVASILKNSIRATDFLGRWGGEEFLIICPEMSLLNIEKLAEKIRKKIESSNFKIEDHITWSFGGTEYSACENKENAFNRVDKALYMAKEQGRNKVVTLK